MNWFDKLDDREKSLISSLPYRAGLWVSLSDSTGGGDADDAELKALESILIGFVEDFCKSELVESVMKQTLARKDEWPAWKDNIHTLPEQMRESVGILAGIFDYNEVSSFKSSLMDVAMTVAMAFREYGEDMPAGEKAKVYASYWLKWLECRIRKEQAPVFDQFLNISREEHKALKALADALRLRDKEGLEPVEPEAGAA